MQNLVLIALMGLSQNQQSAAAPVLPSHEAYLKAKSSVAEARKQVKARQERLKADQVVLAQLEKEFVAVTEKLKAELAAVKTTAAGAESDLGKPVDDEKPTQDPAGKAAAKANEFANYAAEETAVARPSGDYENKTEAKMVVSLPEKASLYIDERKIEKPMGAIREFVVNLKGSRVYRIEAAWLDEEGTPVQRKQKVELAGGKITEVALVK